MEHDEALEKLRHPKLRGLDLTGSGVQQLRNKEAKQVLEPMLRELLPRRAKGKEYSSYYRALRVQLLPHNPYFRQDVCDLRQLFHIPNGQIADVDLTQFPGRQQPWDKDDVLNWRQVVGCWLQIHQCIATNVALDSGLPPLPQWLIKSAGTALTYGKNAPLSWLRKKPGVPALYIRRFDFRVPMDHCVAKLIERYQLPWQCQGSLRDFVLTLDCKHLERMPEFDVVMEPVRASIGQAYRVTVDRVDEYTTKKQWEEIYETRIQPRQRRLWEQRGDLPHSKQIESDSLSKPWVIQLYSLIAEKTRSGQRFGIDRALELMSLENKLPPDVEGVDRSVVRRLIKRLDILCKPHD